MAAHHNINRSCAEKTVTWSLDLDHDDDAIEQSLDKIGTPRRSSSTRKCDESPHGDNGDSEIEQLRYRISQLEHLIAMPSPIHHATSTNTYNYASISIHPPPFYSSGLGVGESSNCNVSVPILPPNFSQSAISPPNHETAVALLHRTNQLETLLAGSEIDNRNMKEQLELLNVSKNRQRMEFQEELKTKDLEIHRLQENLRLAEIRAAKNSKKLAALEKYVNTLPSEDELNDLQAKVEKLTSENEYLSNRLAMVKEAISQTQKEMIQKERELQDALTKLEELKPLEEAQESLLKEFQQDSDTKDDFMSYFSNESNVLNLVTLQRTQLLQSKKILKALRAKIAARDEEKNQLIMALADKVKFIGDLQEQVASLQIENENLCDREKRCSASRTELEKECATLKAEIERLETSNLSRKHQFTKLVNLSTQAELCCTELQQLVQLCQSICSGEEPSVEDLVGITCNFVEQEGALNSEGESKDLDLETIVQRLVGIYEVRKNIQQLRTKINNLYTDTLADDVEKCNVQ